MTFSLESPELKALYEAWIEEGRPRSKVPTVDRIDPTKGYEIGNMRWLTLGQNSRLARFELRKKPSGLPPGVRKESHRYSARIRRNYRQVSLGTFDTAEDAHEAYLKAKKEDGR